MVCIVAASKRWHSDLENNLYNRTSKEFIAVDSPEQLTEEYLAKINPEYIFFPHWSHIIPSGIFKKFECVIFHMTDLPFGRGGSPLQNLIASGIYQTQLSALRCEEGIDSGPVYLKKPLSLQGRAQEIYQKANLMIEDMIVEIIKNKITPIPQEGEIVSFKRRKPEDGNLAALDNLVKVYDYIRMLDADGYPNAFIETDKLVFEFSNATLEGNEIRAHVKIKLKKE